MSDRHSLFIRISALLVLQNGLLAIVAWYLSSELGTAMTAGLAAGVILLSVTTAMMATRIAGDQRILPEPSVRPAGDPAPGGSPPSSRRKQGSSLHAIPMPIGLGKTPAPKDRSGTAELDRAQSAELALNMLDAGLRRLAVGDLSVRLETPFPDRFEGLRGDFNRALTMLDDGLCSITTSASTLHGECAEARLRMVQERATITDEAPTLSAARKDLASASTGLKQQEAVTHEIAAMTADARTRLRLAREAAETAARSATGLSGSDERVRAIAALMRDIAFRTNMLSVNANIEAARSGATDGTMRNFAMDLRGLAEEGAEVARQASIVERDIALAITAATSSIDRLNREGRQVENGLEAMETRLSSALSRFDKAGELVARSHAALEDASRTLGERRSLDKSVETVLERMAQELAIINRSCGHFIPVTVLHEGGAPPDDYPPRPRSHLRLVKT